MPGRLYARFFFNNFNLSSPHWSPAVLPPSELPSDQIRSERQKSRLNKRKAASDYLNKTRDDLFAGGFDRFVVFTLNLSTSYKPSSLIVASEYEPHSIIEKMAPYLAGSASIVVHTPHVQVSARDLSCCSSISLPYWGCGWLTNQAPKSSPVSLPNCHRSLVTPLPGPSSCPCSHL